MSLALISAYVTLPWWLPAGLLRGWLEQRISGQIGLKCRIGSLKVSWSDGIRIESFAVDNPPGFDGRAILQARRVGADFSPVRLAATGRLAWIEAEHLRLNICVDERGNSNLAAIDGLAAGPQPNRLTVRDATVTLRSSQSPRPLSLRISDLQFLSRTDPGPSRVTVSGSLLQQGEPATIIVRAAVGTGPPSVAASATVSLTHLNLQELDLPGMLKLPLKRLAGLCSGSIDLRINRQLVVDQFGLDLDISNLDVQPVAGPALPVIEKARCRVAAEVDLLNNKIDCRSLDMHLPGVDLKGAATVFTQIRLGSWEAIESLRLTGTIRPSAVAAMLSGRPELPGGLAVDGSVGVDFGASRNGSKLSLQATLGAGEAEIRRRGVLLKPRGTELSARFACVLDERDWRLEIQSGQLQFGENRFWGSGAVRQANRLLSGRASGPAGEHLNWALGEVSRFDCNGGWEIRDLEALGGCLDLLPAAGGLAAVELDGAAEGEWQVQNIDPGLTQLRASVRIPPATNLAVGDIFAKSPGAQMVLALAARVDHEASLLRDIYADLAAGEGKLSLDRGFARFSPAAEDNGSWSLEVSGSLEAHFLESVLAGVTPLVELGVDCRGSATGQFEASFAAGAGSASLQADLTDTAVSWREAELKRPSAPAGLSLNLSRQILADGQMGEKLSMNLTSAQMSLAAELSGPGLTCGQRDTGAAKLRVGINDVARLVDIFRPPAEIPAGGRLSGLLNLELEGAWAGSDMTWGVRVDADGLELRRSGASFPGSKAPGVPLQLHAFGRNRLENGRTIAEIDSANLQFADNRLSISAQARFSRNLGDLSWTDGGEFVHAVSGITGRAYLQFRSEESLEQLLPSASDWIRGGELSGWMELVADKSDEDTWSASLSLDGIGGAIRDKEVLLNGRISLFGAGSSADHTPHLGRLRTDGLQFRIGENRGWIVAELTDVLSATSGSVHLLCEYLDDKDLMDWFAGRLRPPTQPAKLTPQQATSLLDKADRIVSVLREIGEPAQMTFEVWADHLRTYDATVSQFYDVHNFALDATVDNGVVSIQYAAGLNGGCYRDEMYLDLTEPLPLVRRHTQITDVVATENIQPQLAKFFPGNTVFGYFNRSEDVEVPLRDMVAFGLDWRYPLHPSGTGKTVTRDGEVRGRAAPKFVTAVFSGLNLAKYRYNTMTGFSEFLADGTAVNDMIFSGPVYDVYIEGKTSADNIGVYDIGLILVGTSAEWQHQWKQVRIPIIKFKGRIEGGEIHDEQVSYFWPNETLFIIFLRNNIFYRMWLNARGK